MSPGRLEGLRRRLGDAPGTRLVVGGADDQPSASLRQGVLGSLMIMVGSWGVGWLALPPNSVFARTTLLNPLRVEPVGVVVCAILLMLGSLLLVRAWLRLGQRLEGRWENDSSAAVVTRATWLWSLPLLLAFPVFSRDVYSYLSQGRLLHSGLNPYEDWISELPGWFMQGADSIWAESPSPYGPLFLLLSRAVWFITGGSPEPAVLLFRAVSLAGMALCLWAVPRLARRFSVAPAWSVWISVTNPLFALYMIAGIHNDSVMVGLLLAGFVLIGPTASVGRNLVGLVLVSLSIAIKPLTVIALPFAGLLLLGERPRLLARIRVWGVCLLVAAAVMVGAGALTGLWFGWIPAMLSQGEAAFPYAPFGLFGLGVGWVVDALTGAGIRPVAEVVYTLGKVAAALFAAWLALTRRPAHPVLATGAALLAAVLLAPIIQPWYLLWVLPLFAVVRHWRGWSVWSLYLLVMLLVVIGVVDQLSVAQWISLAWVRIITGVVGLTYMVFIVFLDPRTSTLFPLTTGSSRRGADRPDTTDRPDTNDQEKP